MKPTRSYTIWFTQRTGNSPLTIAYEDLVQDYEGTIRTILEFLGSDSKSVTVAPPAQIQLADDISEASSQRFRHERQNGWTNRGW